MTTNLTIAICTPFPSAIASLAKSYFQHLWICAIQLLILTGSNVMLSFLPSTSTSLISATGGGRVASSGYIVPGKASSVVTSASRGMKVPGGRVFGAANAAEKHRSKVWNEQFPIYSLPIVSLKHPYLQSHGMIWRCRWKARLLLYWAYFQKLPPFLPRNSR